MTDAMRSRRSHLTGAAIEAALVGAAGVIDQAARFVIGVVAAGVLGPVVFGSWSLIAVVIQYANVLSLGVSTGAARAIPIARGAADEGGVIRIEASARFRPRASSFLAGGAAALVVWLLAAGALEWWLCGLVGLAVVAQQQVVLDQSLMRSRFQFQRAGVEGLAQGIAGLVFGLLLVPLGIAGLTASRIAAGLAALAVGAPGRIGRPAPVWDVDMTKSLIRQGFPLVFAASMFGLLITIDRWVVLGLYGEEALGVFSLASIVLSGLRLGDFGPGQPTAPCADRLQVRHRPGSVGTSPSSARAGRDGVCGRLSGGVGGRRDRHSRHPALAARIRGIRSGQS